MIYNHRNLVGAFARLLLCAALLTTLPLLTACGDNNDYEAQAQTVQVQLTDQQIQMPASLPSGMTTFEIKNTGTMEHSFGVSGPAGDKVLDEPLKPGETAELEMDLGTGTYRVYRPGEQSNGHPIQIALNVTPNVGAGQG